MNKKYYAIAEIHHTSGHGESFYDCVIDCGGGYQNPLEKGCEYFEWSLPIKLYKTIEEAQTSEKYSINKVVVELEVQ